MHLESTAIFNLISKQNLISMLHVKKYILNLNLVNPDRKINKFLCAIEKKRTFFKLPHIHELEYLCQLVYFESFQSLRSTSSTIT